jgi:hypothetical protein
MGCNNVYQIIRQTTEFQDHNLNRAKIRNICHTKEVFIDRHITIIFPGQTLTQIHA